jgi:hypothetical protein
MTRTKLGKYLVFANFVLSICFLGIAVGVASNRIDWPGTAKAGGAGEIKAGIALKTEEIKKFQEAANAAYTRQTAALADLLKVEQERPAKRKWYADQLSILATAKDSAEKAVQGAPVGNIKYVNGQLQLDPKTGLPILEAIQGLKPVPEMTAELHAVHMDIQNVMKNVENHIKEEERLTKEINGDPKAKTKGLRALLAEEVAVEKNLQGELEYLRPLRYNRQVEAALLLKRQLSLKARLDELKNLGVAARF